MSLNRAEFIGNLGSDPEIKLLENGTKLAKFSIAVTETWKDKAGEKQQRTEWISVVCFSKISDVIETYLKKGHKVYISGKWMTNNWETENGEKRSRTELNLREMIMLSTRSESAQQYNEQSQSQQQQTPPPQTSEQNASTGDNDGDLPF